jgi:hypothetical protein
METSDAQDAVVEIDGDAEGDLEGPPDAAGIVRGMATVLLLWGLGFLAARLVLHLGDWATVTGVLLCAVAAPMSAVRRGAPA